MADPNLSRVYNGVYNSKEASVSYVDKNLTCRDCGTTFIFSAGEQEFYATKGFQNEPARCPECRRIRRNRMSMLSSGPRQMFPVICAQCGVETEVPFQPRGDRPVPASTPSARPVLSDLRLPLIVDCRERGTLYRVPRSICLRIRR